MRLVGQVALGARSTRSSGRQHGHPATPDRCGEPARAGGAHSWLSGVGQVGFVGRRAELSRLATALEHARIVTVTGPGGAGKSVLAREAVKRERTRFAGSVLVVSLDGVDDPDAVVEAAVGDLGRRAGAGVMDAAAVIGSREVLLVLDGCEHIAQKVGRLAASLITSCSGLRVLATSQHRLHATGEHVVPLGPLELPPHGVTDPSAVLSYDAVELFVRHARHARPDLLLDERSVAAVARTCRHLEGAPLALELVAPLVGEMDLESLASAVEGEVIFPGRRTEGPERHRSLDAVLGWSLSLLSQGERRLLEELSAFPGGADAESLVAAAESEGVSRTQVVEDLGTLAGKSIVLVDLSSTVARFDLPGMVRRHVRAALERDGRLAELERLQLDWCLEITSGAEDALVTGPGQAGWLDRLEREHANLCAALDFALRERDAPAAAKLASSMWRFWELRGRLREGRGRLEKVLAVTPEACELRSHLLDGLGMIAWRQGDHDGAREALEAALACAVASGNDHEASRVRNHLGLVHLFGGSSQVAGAMFEQSRKELERLDMPGEAALASANLSLVAVLEGRFAEACDLADASLAVHAALGDRHGRAISLLHRAIACYFLGDVPCSQAQAREAAGVLCELGDERSAAFAILALAGSLAVEQPVVSLKLAGLAASMAESVGVTVPAGWDARIDAALAPAMSAAGAEAAELIASGRGMDPGSLLAQVEVLSSAKRHAGASYEVPGKVMVTTLGGFQVRRDGWQVRLAPQAARLVKVVISAGHPVHVEQVIEALWPEVDLQTGRRRLRNLLSKVRLAGGAIVGREADTLFLTAEVQVDAASFSALASAATGSTRSAGDGVSVRRLLRQAAKLYTGDFLPEDPYELWAGPVRERLRRQWLRVLDTLATEARDEGDVDEAEECLRAGIEADPNDESRYIALAELLAACRRPGAALAVLARARAAAAELELPVSPSVVDLEERLRARYVQC